MKRVLLAAFLAALGALPAAADAPRVLLAPYDGIITPIAAEFMTQAVERAERENYDALIVQMDTPGGLDASMRIIVKRIMNAKVPVIVYVHPTGSRAASAGVFITMAAHVAAMAPGTNIGAAHPVALGGGGSRGGGDKEGKKDPVLEEKAVNDAAAYLRSIAQKRGRNAEWSYEAVSKSTSIPAGEALALNVIDFLADDLNQLLEKIDGQSVQDFDEPLKTKNAVIDRHEMTRRQRWLATIADPNVAMILMSLGAGGLFIELYNPGLILPGVVGGVCLLLAFYSFQTLSASYAGVLLMILGMVFFLFEIKVASYGVLALGGVVATLLGILMLFQESMGGLAVSWGVIAGTLAGLTGVTALVSYLVYKAYSRKGETGKEGMIGAHGEAITKLSPEGRVMVQGEIWQAYADGGISKGEDIVVEAVEGLRLKVRKRA